MKNKHFVLIASLTSLLALYANPAEAQIGPDLRPPGLSDSHPIDSYSEFAKGSAKRLEQSWELNAGDVVFSAARKRQLISEAPSTIHVITSKDIANHGWRSLAEIMRHVPGVQTITTKSQFQSVMIRGLVGTEDNNSRILWLQNGVPMNDVRDSGIWLDETYPVEMIKRIEVVLGPGSALYGSGAFQGVVNIFTKDPEDIDKYGEYHVAMQNNLTFKGSAIAAYTSEDGKLGILGHVSGNTTQGPGLVGDYVYTNYAMDQAGDSVSGYNVPTYRRYENIATSSAKHWYNINFKLHYDDFKWNLGFTDIYAEADGSEIVPTIYYNLADNNIKDEGVVHGEQKTDLYHFNRREFYNDFIYEHSFNDEVALTSVLSYRFGQYSHTNYGKYASGGNDVVIPGGTSETFQSDFDTFQHKLYGQAQVNWQIYEATAFIAGIALEYQNIESGDFIAGYSDSSDVGGVNSSINMDAQKIGHFTPSVYLQDEQRFWDDRIILTLGGRFDVYRLYSSDDFDPDLAPSWRFALLGKWTDWMTMRLSYGYSFKEPSLYQLYVNTLDYVGNSKLKPETLHNIELSFLFNPTYYMKIRLDGFATFMKNLIIMQYKPESALRYYGIDGRFTPVQEDGGADIFGFEVSLDATLPKNWSIYSHYNFLYSMRNYDYSTASSLVSSSVEKDRVPDDAMHRVKLGATYSDDRVSADFAWFLVGGTPKTESNDPTKDSYQTPFYAIFQPQISVGLGANIGATLQGSYAFSEGMTKSPTYRYYYEKQGVPVSRYSVMLGLTYPFRPSADK